MSDRIATEIERYLKTGQSDPMFSAWPGGTFFENTKQGSKDLTNALLAEVHRRQEGIRVPKLPRGFKPYDFARQKLAPMVRGLLPKVEQEVVLEVLARSVVFVHPGNIGELLEHESFHADAWQLANLYLHSVGAETLDGAGPYHVGMGIHKTSYVSMLYFGKTGRFEDFVLHEAAHVFHNCKRQTVGLPFGRNREWILPVAFRKRELLAHSCEAYGKILELAKRPVDRKDLLARYADGHVPSEVGQEREEHLAILEAAVGGRNGWKVILEACREPSGRGRRRSVS